jgi:hypothetical protein
VGKITPSTLRVGKRRLNVAHLAMDAMDTRDLYSKWDTCMSFGLCWSKRLSNNIHLQHQCIQMFSKLRLDALKEHLSTEL